jgi:hypothetical protein
MLALSSVRPLARASLVLGCRFAASLPQGGIAVGRLDELLGLAAQARLSSSLMRWARGAASWGR